MIWFEVANMILLPLWTRALWLSLDSLLVLLGPESPPTCPEVVPWWLQVWDQAPRPAWTTTMTWWAAGLHFSLRHFEKSLLLTQVMSSNPGSSSGWDGRLGSWAERGWMEDSGGRIAALKKFVTLENPPNVVAYGSWINLCENQSRRMTKLLTVIRVFRNHIFAFTIILLDYG